MEATRVRLSEMEQQMIARASECGHDLDTGRVVELAERIKDIGNEWRAKWEGKFQVFAKREINHFCEAVQHLITIDNPEYGRLIPSDVLKAIQREKINTASIDRIIEVGLARPESQPEIDRLHAFGKRVWGLHKDCRALLEKFTDIILVDGDPLTGPIGLGCDTLDVLEGILDAAGDMSPENVAIQISIYMQANHPL